MQLNSFAMASAVSDLPISAGPVNRYAWASSPLFLIVWKRWRMGLCTLRISCIAYILCTGGCPQPPVEGNYSFGGGLRTGPPTLYSQYFINKSPHLRVDVFPGTRADADDLHAFWLQFGYFPVPVLDLIMIRKRPFFNT